jgi:hypothetical protein
MSDALDIAEEDLAYMRDIAEREAINRFTTAEIKLNSTMKTTFPKIPTLTGLWMRGPMILLKSWMCLKKGCMSNGIQNVLGWCAYAHHPFQGQSEDQQPE